MKPLHNILVIADSDMQQSPALRRGFELAWRCKARLHLCIVAHSPVIDGVGVAISEEVRRLARQQFMQVRLSWLEARAASNYPRAECHVVWADVLYEGVLAKALELEADLVIKDAAAESSLHRLMFAPRDLKLVRFCPATLMLVHPRSGLLSSVLLAAVDAWMDTEADGTLNQRIVSTATELARCCGAPVHVASSFPWIKLFSAPDHAIETAFLEAERSFDQKLGQFAQSLRLPEDRLHRLRGHAALALKECAARIGADLLVIGSHYRTGVDRLFLGDTAEEILGHAGGDIVIVRPAHFMDEIVRLLPLAQIRKKFQGSTVLDGKPPVAAQVQMEA